MEPSVGTQRYARPSGECRRRSDPEIPTQQRQRHWKKADDRHLVFRVVVKAERARLRLRQGQWKRSLARGERAASRPLEQPGPRRSERPEQGKAKQVAEAGQVAPLVVCGAQRASLAEGHLDKELPPHSVYMERSWSSHGNPGGWGNSFEGETRTEQSRAAVELRYREYLRSPSGRWVRYRLHELVGKKCFCHCSLDEVCHVDEILKVMDDEQRARTRDDRPQDLGRDVPRKKSASSCPRSHG